MYFTIKIKVMSNYFYHPSEIHIWKEKYEKNKMATINECMSEPPFCYNPQDKIEKLVFIEPNEYFQKLTDYLPKYAEKFESSVFEFYDTNSRFKFNKTLRVTRNIRVICPYGIITISMMNDGLELENIAIDESKQGQGWGSKLMLIFFDLLLDTFGFDLPPIYLDCIGTATLGNEYITNEVSLQCKFFRKYGFRVTKYHKTGKGIEIINNQIVRTTDHAEMKLDMEKWYQDFYSKIDLVESE